MLRGKKLLLYQKLLEGSGCPDVEPFELMQGMELVGTASRSKFFDTKLNLATASPNFTLLTAKWQRHKIGARDVHADDKEVSKLLWGNTIQEVEAGFLEGPFYEFGQVQECLGCMVVVVSRRFATMQSGKPRIIDDLKESGINKAYTAVDSLALPDVDYVVSLAHWVTATIHHAKKHPGRCVNVTLEDVSVLSGTLHSDFGTELEWRGRCKDLSKAYKQVPVSRSSRPFAVLMVHHYETGRPVYFLSNSLPFGASASVFGFNRISRTLWFIASHCCSMMGGVFYDDFPFVEPAKLCALASQSFEDLLRALGWRFSDDRRSHILLPRSLTYWG